MFNMYRPTNAKLNYGNNRIFLIFAHYNWFGSDGGHTGDSVITFNNELNNYDFGNSWGCSHSLQQSVTQDSKFFWSASLGDAYPLGISIQWTSKTEVKGDTRKYNSLKQIGEKISGDKKGRSSGKLGGLLYSEKDNKYILVFSHTNDNENKKRHGIYMTTFKYDETKDDVTNIKTYEIKKLSSKDDIVNINAGLIDNKIAILYLYLKNNKVTNYYCNVPQGSEGHYLIANTKGELLYDSQNAREKLYLPTNEELRNLKDGSLTYATVDKEGYLNIIKITKAHESNISSDSTSWNNFLIAISIIILIIVVFILFDILYLKPRNKSILSKLCKKNNNTNKNEKISFAYNLYTP